VRTGRRPPTSSSPVTLSTSPSSRYSLSSSRGRDATRVREHAGHREEQSASTAPWPP
jgi:hypothetical protein